MAAMLNVIVAESIMVPQKHELMEPALPAMLQKEVERIHDAAENADQLSSVTDQQACQSKVHRDAVVALKKKFEFFLDSLQQGILSGYEYKELIYYLSSLVLSASQLAVDGVLADKGQAASTSPATIMADVKNTKAMACREAMAAMVNAAKAGDLTSALFKTSMSCIMDDMNKCVETIRGLEWASAAIDNTQSIIDTIWTVLEIRSLRGDADKVKVDGAALAKTYQAENNAAAKQEVDALEADGKTVDETRESVADLKKMIDQMKTHLHQRGVLPKPLNE